MAVDVDVDEDVVTVNHGQDMNKRSKMNDMSDTSDIDFLNDPPAPRAPLHVIAARLTAESPRLGFKPTTGLIESITMQSAQDTWGYFAVGRHGRVHEHGDSQFGHVFASGPTREAARKVSEHPQHYSTGPY